MEKVLTKQKYYVNIILKFDREVGNEIIKQKTYYNIDYVSPSKTCLAAMKSNGSDAYSTSAIVSEKKEKAKSDKGKKKLKDSKEDNKVETNEVIKKDEEKKNEDDEKKDSEVINDTNYNQSLSNLSYILQITSFVESF